MEFLIGSACGANCLKFLPYNNSNAYNPAIQVGDNAIVFGAFNGAPDQNKVLNSVS